MRFLILSQYFAPEMGAAQLRLTAFARELVAAGHEVEVVTAMPNHPNGAIFPAFRGAAYRLERSDGMTIHRVWLYAALGAGLKRMANYSSFMAMSTLGLARSRRPDFVFIESPPLFLGITGILAAKAWGVPAIFNVADLWPDSVKLLGILREGPILRFAEALERWIYRHARYVNAVTDGIRDVLLGEKRLAPDKVLFLPNGVDTELFRPSPPDPELAGSYKGKRVLLYAGTHGYAHGIEVALRAAARLRGSDWRFVFIGEGSEKQNLIRQAMSLELDNVEFLDAAPPEYVARLLSVSFAGLSTLRNSPLFEGTRPVKIFSTMAAGKPVLYSGAGEGARMIAAADAGLVSPPEDEGALVEAIERLGADSERAAQMGRNGRHLVETQFGWASIVSTWLASLKA